MRNAGKRNLVVPCRWHGRASSGDAHVCRRSTAVLARGIAHPQGSASGQASWDATGALDPLSPLQVRERRSYARGSPARPVPAQGCTSRPGHSAGGLMPEPPGSGLQLRPRAPPSLQRPGVPPGRVLHASEDGDVTDMGTDVKVGLIFGDGHIESPRRGAIPRRWRQRAAMDTNALAGYRRALQVRAEAVTVRREHAALRRPIRLPFELEISPRDFDCYCTGTAVHVLN
jgi:hypothetical protein